jgi:hypothetical protein
VDVYGQYAFWHLIRNDGRDSRIWSYYDKGNHKTPFYHPQLRHFTADGRPYIWDRVKPLDWQRIAADYDYIVLVTEDNALRKEVSTHACRELTVGAISLYVLDAVYPYRCGT